MNRLWDCVQKSPDFDDVKDVVTGISVSVMKGNKDVVCIFLIRTTRTNLH